MRTLQMIKKEALHILHSPESLLLMLLFPLLLTWVLGTAFAQSSIRTMAMPETRVAVISDGSPTASLYISSADQSGIRFDEESREEIERKISSGAAKQYVEINGKDIILHSDDQEGMDAMMLKIYSAAFVRQANLTGLAIREGKLGQAAPQFHEYVKTEGLDSRNEPNSFGYYGVAMLTMIIMYGALQTVGLLATEKIARTQLRLKASPYSMSKAFLIKMLMAALMLAAQVLLLLIVNHLVYGVNYRSIPVTLVMLMPLILFSTALGVASYQIMRNESSAISFLHLATIAMVFLGGGYLMATPDNAFMLGLTRFSPVGWMNQGLFKYIYQDNLKDITRDGLILLGISLFLYVLSYVLFKKEEGSDRVAAY